MLADVSDLKANLGIAPEDGTKDQLLDQSLTLANSIIAAYIGFDVSDVDTEQSYTEIVDENADYVRLPLFPLIDVLSVTADGDLVDPTAYYVDPKLGHVNFLRGIPRGSAPARWGHRMGVRYLAGLEEIPEDLSLACLNIAAGIYNLGGTFASVAQGTGELKSLTMFDAMSMSFDTTQQTGTDAAGTPQAMLKAWSFVLDKYRCKTPTMR
jgi:hypothetical protein